MKIMEEYVVASVPIYSLFYVFSIALVSLPYNWCIAPHRTSTQLPHVLSSLIWDLSVVHASVLFIETASG